MRHVVTTAVLAAALVLQAGLVSGQTAPAAGTSIGRVTLRQQVLADGQPLAPGTYQVRLSADMPAPAVGQSPEGARYVEFVRGAQVAGREVATVVSAADLGQIAKGLKPVIGGTRVEMLKGNDYVRVWINQGGMNYIIHMPPAPPA
jgi:hypothetical protein